MNTYNTFAHIPLDRGTATLAIRETTREGKPALIEIGVAFCSPNEQFSRRIGRTIAEGRLNTKRRYYCVVERNPALNIKKQAEAMLFHLIDGNNVVFEEYADDNELTSFGWQAPHGEVDSDGIINLFDAPIIRMPTWVEDAADFMDRFGIEE